MSADPYTPSAPNLANLRQWHRPRSNSRTRSPSSSSLSSADPSCPSTPQDAVFPPLPIQITPRPAVSACNEDYWTPRRLDISSTPRSSVDSSRELRESPPSPESGDDDCTDISRSRTQTITPVTVFRARNHEQLDHIMRIPFPSNQRDSASSTGSQSGPDSVSLYDEELGGLQPTRHPLRNRVNSKGNSTQRADVDGELASPTKYQRGCAHTHRPESTHSTASTQSSASFPRTSASLRLKAKKMHSQRGAMNLFKSLASSAPPTPPTEFENIEFDWGEKRRGELEKRVKLLEQEYSEERKAVQFHVPSLNGEAEPSRPGSWEFTPEELTLRRHLEEEDARRFELKNHMWINSSCVSAHPKDSVPYPLAYDRVDLQNDRHSHDLVRQIFSGRPSIHDDISQKNPVTVLDLGCGDGSWIVDAAQCWRTTVFYGLDVQRLHPSHAQLVTELGEQVAENIRFTYFNFLNDKLPYLDEKFDMVRMANLKWAIPESNWDLILEEVHRVLKRGGWVEIIDDDFVLPVSPSSTLSGEQLAASDNLETQLKNMLHERNLPLNIPSHFMTEKLGSQFNAYHEEDFAIAISMARPSSVEGGGQVFLPAEGMSQKAAKLMGIGFDDKRPSSGTVGSRSRSRSRSGSVSSTASRSTRDDLSVFSEGFEEQFVYDSTDSLPKPRPMFQPIGLDVHPGRFIPFSPNELAAHSVRNMQNILACKEAIRMNELRKSPDLTGLEVKDGLLPNEQQRFKRLSFEWDEQRRAFDDVFWEFESAMLKRLSLPDRSFDVNEDDFVKPGLRPQSHRTRSQRGSDVSLTSPTPSTFSLASTVSTLSTTSTHPLGSSIPVRFLRVYSGWK